MEDQISAPVPVYVCKGGRLIVHHPMNHVPWPGLGLARVPWVFIPKGRCPWKPHHHNIQVPINIHILAPCEEVIGIPLDIKGLAPPEAKALFELWACPPPGAGHHIHGSVPIHIKARGPFPNEIRIQTLSGIGLPIGSHIRDREGRHEQQNHALSIPKSDRSMGIKVAESSPEMPWGRDDLT